MRIAITGGRGRLAPGLASYLVSVEHSVQTFSRSAGDGHRSLAELADPGILAEFDAVLHLGWSSVPAISEKDPGIEEREDLPFVRSLVSATSACAKPPRLFFFSTAAVYGNTGESPADEDRECRPLGRYAAAKLEAEWIVLCAPDSAVLRITNVFGASCNLTRPQGVIPAVIAACRQGSAVTIWGDGNASKDYIAVGDLHAAVAALLLSARSGTFNVASGSVFSVNEIVSLVSEASGRPVRVERAPHFAWDVEEARISAARLRSATGWMPVIDPVSAISALVKV